MARKKSTRKRKPAKRKKTTKRKSTARKTVKRRKKTGRKKARKAPKWTAAQKQAHRRNVRESINEINRRNRGR